MAGGSYGASIDPLHVDGCRFVELLEKAEPEVNEMHFMLIRDLMRPPIALLALWLRGPSQ